MTNCNPIGHAKPAPQSHLQDGRGIKSFSHLASLEASHLSGWASFVVVFLIFWGVLCVFVIKGKSTQSLRASFTHCN